MPYQQWACEICGAIYDAEVKAVRCEARHRKRSGKGMIDLVKMVDAALRAALTEEERAQQTVLVLPDRAFNAMFRLLNKEHGVAEAVGELPCLELTIGPLRCRPFRTLQPLDVAPGE